MVSHNRIAAGSIPERVLAGGGMGVGLRSTVGESHQLVLQISVIRGSLGG